MKHKNMCDPVHGIMCFENELYITIKRVIDSPYFQRLRQIKQLSFAEFAYPGAVHNRFSHSIGACYLSTVVFSTIYNDSTNNEDQKICLALTALIHDIGHGPFSHSFEKIFNYALNFVDKKMGKISHEDWTQVFLKKLIEENYIETNYGRVVEDIYTKETNKLHGIISSQLDVDRFDYLLRDSHFCGVSYGNFDLLWLINRLCEQDGVICIEEKGINTLEHYIMARRFMNKNVYFHKIKCSFEYMLTVIFKLVQKNLDELSLYQELQHSALIVLLQAMREIKQRNKNKFLYDLFPYYTELTDYDIWILLKQISSLNIQNQSQEIGLLKLLSSNLIYRKCINIRTVKSGYTSLIEAKVKEFIDEHTDLSEYIIEFDHTDFGVYKIYGEEINYATGSGYRNVLSKSSLLKSSQAEEVRYLYFIDIQSINLELNNKLQGFIESLKAYIY
ncbi:TPA: HD domain-containing protein [Legionella pneumophila]